MRRLPVVLISGKVRTNERIGGHFPKEVSNGGE